MAIGDEVLQADGSWKRIEAVELRGEGAKVFNFEVFDNHNYFVGEHGTLVHNRCYGNIPENIITVMTDYLDEKGGTLALMNGLKWLKEFGKTTKMEIILKELLEKNLKRH